MRPRFLAPALTLLLVLHATGSLADVTFPLNSHEDFLRADPTDVVGAPLVVTLADHGFAAGNALHIQPVGDFDNGPGEDQFDILVAVFSSSATVLSPALQYRVPDAVDAGLVANTGLTCPSNYATNIAFDFYVTSAGVDVTIPAGATHLMVMTGDCFFSDNSDPDGDFAVQLTHATASVAPHADASLQLLAPRPNPVRTGTTFEYRTAGGPVSLALYAADGRRVRTLVAGALPAGSRFAAWDGRGDGGEALPAGLYFVRLATAGGNLHRKVVHLP